ncbi:hypothetical protein O181_023818 [Austropuccinia psidii MF-1]|uniref:Uncharacterized protein n=1 Tax=Austropuccinia psidii MF-1 TaxID=1389203 RepID=A0A9Q3GXM5_9BASI|nr:hypothetical protein [Austropuccinia psidii MF-1]
MSSNTQASHYSIQSQLEMAAEQTKTTLPDTFSREHDRDVESIIDQGINMIKNEHLLCIDDSNFPTWEHRLQLIFDNYLQDPMYLQQSILGKDRTEHIFHDILLSSFPDSIKDSIITLRPCSAI